MSSLCFFLFTSMYTVVKFIIIYQMNVFLFQESKAETKEEKKGNTPSKETVIKRVNVPCSETFLQILCFSFLHQN